jgi:hypothetical protein
MALLAARFLEDFGPIKALRARWATARVQREYAYNKASSAIPKKIEAEVLVGLPDR